MIAIHPCHWIWDQIRGYSILYVLRLLLVKGSEEISSEFHSELIPDLVSWSYRARYLGDLW